jgi:glycosyltransferase involved in cell wall biosynthesis
MNIGVNTRYLIPELTGIGRYTMCILDELQRIDSGNNYYLMEYRPSDYALTNPRWKKVYQNSKMPGPLWLQTVVPGLIKKHKIDVFWSPEAASPLCGIPADTKLVTTVHDFVFWRYQMAYGFLVSMKNRLLFAKTLKRSAALVPVSNYIKDELIQLYPALRSASKVIRTVSNGVKDWNHADTRAQRENFLFFPGNLDPRKNLFRLIKALETVNASGFGIDLHICGPARWRNTELRKLIKSSPVKDRIKHLGYITDDELMNQYLSCKAVVFPSVYEGFGLPILEALRLGTPVLTSKGTVMEEIAGESALYFDPYDTGSIAETIINFLKTGGPAINRERLSRYCWRQSAEDLLEVFTDVCKKERP